ncbi:hypothetical protein GHI93_07515 [Lactococcus hircilactis]|uniref:DUF960 domain-containing protein n=1 Tax=Lactococcus hircilactis TaxID=1494462 RepID=A0A7X2D0S9_9LACT|nr:DUF960 domain-containing protein [Lactococcus hircilactis]MQW39771.1 hypothetical protein [Lactococcus hircilactis]
MAFTQAQGRYASFKTVASIPGEVIDAFWFIIDYQLKGVITMGPKIDFQLINSSGFLSIRFSQKESPTTITVDFDYPFDHEWPTIFHAIDQSGRETIITDHE